MCFRWAALAATLLLAPVTATAVEVTIDLGDYKGSYRIDKLEISNNHKYDLAPGTYKFTIAPGAGFRFDVEDENGTAKVTSQNPVASPSNGTDNVLRLKTAPVVLDPAGYKGKWQVNGVPKFTADGNRRVYVLVKGLAQYTVQIAPSNAFFFTVDGNGAVTPLNPVNAAAAGNVLSFHTQRIQIEPNGYPGTYSVVGVDEAVFSGPRSVVLIPGVQRYVLKLEHSNDFRFDVTDSSRVETPQTVAAEGVGRILEFRPVTVHVTPDDLGQLWYIRGAEVRPGMEDERDVVLLPDVHGYILTLAPGVASVFDLDAAAAADPHPIIVGTAQGPKLFRITRPSWSCRLAVTAKLLEPVSDSLKKDDVIRVEADLEVSRTPRVLSADQNVYDWVGRVTLFDEKNGEEAEARSGAIWVSDPPGFDAIGLALDPVTGSLGGKKHDPGRGPMLYFQDKMLDFLNGPDFPAKLSVWNSPKQIRQLVLYFGASLGGELGALSYSGTGCE